MSTLVTNTFTGKTSAGSIVVTGEGGSTTTNLQQGLKKVWINLNGGGTGDSGVIIPDAWCFSTTKFIVITFWTDASYYDRDYTHGVLHGDLA